MNRRTNSQSLQSTILIVDDAPASIGALSELLEQESYRVLAALNFDEALASIERIRPDLVLLDIRMPGRDGVQTCVELKKHPNMEGVPVIFLTGTDREKNLPAAFEAGGVDYIAKPFWAPEALSRVRTHLKLADALRQLKEKNSALETEVEHHRRTAAALDLAGKRISHLTKEETDHCGLEGLAGKSPAFMHLIAEVRRVHRFPATNILLSGETGTGKEVIARAIHYGSTSVKTPLIAVNCSALPLELAESHLFGHVRGAFTGAVSDRAGYFELANGGTLFLDEIGDMPLALQAKLLRVMEDGVVVPVGSSRALIVKVRIISATHRDLPSEVSLGNFRQDLFYRLAHYVLRIPALRERREDIPQLAEHFASRFACEMGKKTPKFSQPVIQALSGHDFPGNIRELRNIVERAMICADGDTILPEHIAFTSLSPRKDASEGMAREIPIFPQNLAEAEDMLIRRALADVSGNVSAAARMLGVGRMRVYRSLKRNDADRRPPSS